jgi:hypothetical protein
MRRIVVVGAVLVGLIAASSGAGAPPNPDRTAGPILGVVPTHDAHGPGGGGGGGSNLAYHGGTVLHTNTAYAIYWIPGGYSVSSGYQTVVNRFFGDVAADSGKTSNVYYSDTQYSDGGGKIAYSSTFGGSYVDTNPLPASGCSDPYTAVCLSDGQLQAEIVNAVRAAGWTPGSTSIFFLFTANGIGSCYSGSQCAFSYYCAYHSSFTAGGATYVYANQPYADTVPAACDAGQHPNGDDADATINVTSHEHNEAITDWQGNAWYDRRGQENGDKCAWNFGTVSGPSGAQYNQTINGNHYFLQQEWSNAHSGCVLTGL